jgi:hypothetical protein
MVEIIETLNNTSALRTLFYVIAFIVSIAIAVDGIASIVKSFRK